MAEIDRRRHPIGPRLALQIKRFGYIDVILSITGEFGGVCGSRANTALGLAWPVFIVSCGTARPEIGVPETIVIAAGVFVRGSDRAEREAAYRLDAIAYGHSITRKYKWYESEFARRRVETLAFEITRTLITNAHYAAFIQATGHRSPNFDRQTWQGYGVVHPYNRTRRHVWRGKTPPPGREFHPVVLVYHADARAYVSRKTRRRWRLPSEIEWEKAARGTDGGRFPKGHKFDPKKESSADNGPFDTVPVELYPAGASPFGLLDSAGQVFEWTSPCQTKAGLSSKVGRGTVKDAAFAVRPRVTADQRLSSIF
jgi:formylglycine-generating enzyme required for sulfatase activity